LLGIGLLHKKKRVNRKQKRLERATRGVGVHPYPE